MLIGFLAICVFGPWIVKVSTPAAQRYVVRMQLAAMDRDAERQRAHPSRRNRPE